MNPLKSTELGGFRGFTLYIYNNFTLSHDIKTFGS